MLINNPKRAKQIISFEGMERRRKIIPTDIDGFIDYGGKVFVYMEAKLVGADVPDGQRWALESAVKSHDQVKGKEGEKGHKACAILFRHNTNPEEDIIVKDQYVERCYFKHNDTYKWWNYGKNTVLQFLDKWEDYCEKMGYDL